MSKVFRKVLKTITATQGYEGAGFPIRRPLPSRQMKSTDPFLLLDEMGPINYKPGEAKGAPDHPHRGFETVTYLLEGEMEHKDSRGNCGKLSKGAVQWMTAGRGVVHSEMPSTEILQKGGTLHGFQLWVNLPKKDKMIEPRYQEFTADKLPEAVSSDGKVWVKVIAGSAYGKSAVIETRTPIMYLHVKSRPNSTFSQPVPGDFNVFAYVLRGQGKFGPPEEKETVIAHQITQFEQSSVVAEVNVHNDSTDILEYLLIGGVPLNEPVVQQGPFVMNTQEEIRQAWQDFHNGKLGEIEA